jgi:cyclic-di-GMP-binding protein
VAGEGFEPSKAKPTDLQSAPIGRSGNLPRVPAHRRLAGRQQGERIAQPHRQTKTAGDVPALQGTQGAEMADSSFDIVSKIDRQEVDNALGQTAREIATRFDFKGTGATIEWQGEQAIEISASADDRASAVLDVFKGKLVKRDVSLKVLDASEPRQSGQQSKISITLKEGISSEDAKKISKLIRDEGPKGVKAQIQGDELRVSSKKRDDLQAVQALVRGQDYDFAVQFTNYR